MKPKKAPLSQDDLKLIEDQFQKGTPIPVILKNTKITASDFYLLKLKNEFEQKNFIQNKQDRFIEQLNEQNKLTAELEQQIKATTNEHELNDIFRPFRQKKANSKVELAKNQGLEDLAKTLLTTESLEQPLDALITDQLNAEKGLSKAEHVLSGVRTLLEDTFMNNSELRKLIRDTYTNESRMVVSAGTNKKEDQKNPFESLIGMDEPYKSVSPSKYFHIRRGERHKFLNVEFKLNEEDLLNQIFAQFIVNKDQSIQFQMQSVLSDVYHQKLKEIILADLKQNLWNQSQELFIPQINSELFSQLTQPYSSEQTALGVFVSQKGPSGLAVVNQKGEVLAHLSIDIIEETADQLLTTIEEWKTKFEFNTLILQHQKQAQAVYNQLTKSFAEKNLQINIYPMHAHEASLYAELAEVKQAHGQKQAAELSAIYLGQKFLNPLSALLQFDLSTLALGQYQKEIDPEKLKHQLDQVAQFAVCRETLNVNTASKYELSYIPGLNLELADAILEKRKSAPLDSLDQLKEISGVTDESFANAQSFLRTNDENFKSQRRLRFTLSKNRIDFSELTKGYKTPAIVQNFAIYGVFVHVGAFQDLLIHKNNLPDTLKMNFSKALSLGQKVDVEVADINAEGLPQLKWLDKTQRTQRSSFKSHAPRSGKHKKGSPQKRSKPKKSEFGTLADQFAGLMNK